MIRYQSHYSHFFDTFVVTACRLCRLCLQGVRSHCDKFMREMGMVRVVACSALDRRGVDR